MTPLQQPPLLDLLGARWALSAAVVGVAWDVTNAVAGFALADGALALAPRGWQGAPRVAQRQGGGIELVPASEPPPPVTRAVVQDGPCRGIAAHPGGGFITLGNGGVLAATTADGLPTDVPHVADTPVAMLASAPEGAALAIGHAGGITLLMPDAGARLVSDVPPAVLACGAHGAVAAWTGGHGLRVWSAGAATRLSGGDAAPLMLSFLDDGRSLTMAGQSRPLCWRLGPHASDPEPSGIGGRHLVTAVAGHPRRAMLAAGYAHGAVLLCHQDRKDVLFLRQADGSTITALAWSGEGRRLAIGTEGGEVAVLALPDALFRDETPAAGGKAA